VQILFTDDRLSDLRGLRGSKLFRLDIIPLNKLII